MTRGKPWTFDEEKQLKKMLGNGTSIEIVADKLGRKVDAVRMKIVRLGLSNVVEHSYRTTTLKMPKDLFSVEEALQFLAAALKASVQPGLDKVEVQRLNAVANLAKTYKEILADYVNYRGIEEQIVEMQEKYSVLLDNAIEESKHNASKVAEASDQKAEY